MRWHYLPAQARWASDVRMQTRVRTRRLSATSLLCREPFTVFLALQRPRSGPLALDPSCLAIGAAS